MEGDGEGEAASTKQHLFQRNNFGALRQQSALQNLQSARRPQGLCVLSTLFTLLLWVLGVEAPSRSVLKQAILQGLEEFAGVWFPQKANKVSYICPSLIISLLLFYCYISKNWKGVTVCEYGTTTAPSSGSFPDSSPGTFWGSLNPDLPAQWEWGHRMLKASLLSALAFSSPARGQQQRVNCPMVPHSQRRHLERSEKNQAWFCLISLMYISD